MKTYIVDIKTLQLIEVSSLRGTQNLKMNAWLDRGESHTDILVKKSEWNKLTEKESKKIPILMNELFLPDIPNEVIDVSQSKPKKYKKIYY